MLLTAGFAAVHVALLGYIAAHQAARPYMECVWLNNFAYIGERHRTVGLSHQVHDVALYLVGPWSAATWLGGIVGCLAAAVRSRRQDAGSLWLLCVVSFAFAGVAGTWYVQYFIPLVLPLALGCGYLLGWLAERALRPTSSLPIKLAALVAAMLILAGPFYKQAPTVWHAARTIDRTAALGPFDESMLVARYLSVRTEPYEPILVLGTDPEIYFYARRKPASRMVLITYPAYGPYPYSPRLAQELTDGLKHKQLRYVVLVNYPGAATEFPELKPDFLALLSGAHRVFAVKDRHKPGRSLEVYRREGAE